MQNVGIIYTIQGAVKIVGWLIFLFHLHARIEIWPSWRWCLLLRSVSCRNQGLTTKQEIWTSFQLLLSIHTSNIDSDIPFLSCWQTVMVPSQEIWEFFYFHLPLRLLFFFFIVHLIRVSSPWTKIFKIPLSTTAIIPLY